jgi:uncharacterized protein (DUF697 family)
VPAQPTRSPESRPAPAAEQPTAEQPASELPASELPASELPASELPPAKRARAAKKATPAKATALEATAGPPKKAAPEAATTPVKAAKRAAAKRTPAKKAAAVGPQTDQPAAVPAAGLEPAATTAEPEPTAVTVAPEPTAVTAAPEPAATTEPEPAVRLRAVTTEPEPQHPDSLVEQLLADPARSPEILAAAAVRTLGPRAGEWAARTRTSYPTASREALARLAVQRFVRSAGLRSGFGALAGPYTPMVLATATVITHAELVLHLAAVYGLDPTDPQRAGDLLKLASPGVGPIVAWVALSLVSRSLPGLGVLTAVLGARATADAVAVQARRFYAEYSSQVSHSSGSSS